MAADVPSQVDLLRSQITMTQRALLTEIWEFFCKNRKGMPIRELHKGMKKSVRPELEKLGGSIVQEDPDTSSAGRNLYFLTALGVLLTENGGKYERLLEQLLEYVANIDTSCTSLDSQTIADELSLTTDEILLLGDLVALCRFPPFWSNGGTGTTEWSINNIGDEVEDIPSDHRQYIHEQVTKYYHDKTPLPLFERQRFSTNRGAVSTSRTDVHGSTQSKTRSAESIQNDPWNRIPDNANDREITRLWHDGLTASQIANKCGLSSDRVNNRVYELRKKFGEGIIPYRQDKRRDT